MNIRHSNHFMPCFSENYSACRALFLHCCKDARAPVTTFKLNTRDSENYYTDVAYFGPDNPKNAVIIVSGTHGVEGYTGSACQSALLSRSKRYKQTAFILVHALNPWGFAHNRRTNENNVDINRNFIDFSNILPKNTEYRQYNSLLLPKSWRGTSRIKADWQLYGELLRGNRQALQNAITQGQYEYPDGLFFGGTQAEWSHKIWLGIMNELSHIPLSLIDIHSGLGQHGKASLLTNRHVTSCTFQTIRNWFGDTLISAANNDNSIPVSYGTLIDTMPEESQSLVLEFGTYSAVRMLNALRKEAIQWQSGDIQRQLKKHFCPLNSRWRKAVLTQFFDILSIYTSMLNTRLH